MRPFAYTRASDAAAALAALGPDVRPYAGGTDLLTRMKLGLARPERLVDIKGLDLPRGIERDGDGLRIGALTTLAEIERHRFPPALALFAEAASKAATPQLRERATVGGNLVQRPRCWYYRDPHVDCWLKGGKSCPAREGRNEQHAIYGQGPCVAVHPSDLASCLLALDARVVLRGPDGERTLALEDFFAEPEEGRRRESVIGEDELITAVEIPSVPEGGASVYLKAMDRKVWAFALVGVAAVRRADADGERVRLVASGVAPVPWRLHAAERALADARPADAGARDAAIDAVIGDAAPLSANGYKVELLGRLLRRAITEIG